MRNKLAILAIILVTNILHTALAQKRHSLYNMIVSAYNPTMLNRKNYLSIQIYLNNNSNDTLCYRGAESDNSLFSINRNPYFHLANLARQPKTYLEALIPPHRSQKMELYLTADRPTNHAVPIVINMKLYQWGKQINKKPPPLLGNLSTVSVLHYGRDYEPFWPESETKAFAKKEKAILPNKDIYLLTDNDRKLYTLNVENEKIGVPKDTVIFKNWHSKKEKVKVVVVPVVLHNNSNDTLKFYSMTCSWYEFFGTNHTGVEPSEAICFKNIPDVVEVAPHGKYRKNLPMIYESSIKSGGSYRISLSILKASENEAQDWQRFYPWEYVRFNKIWSNEIIVQ